MRARAKSQRRDLARFVRSYPGVVDDALIADLIALTGGSKMDEDWRRCSITPVDGDVLERFRNVVRQCFLDYRECSDTLNACTLLEQPNILRYDASTDPVRPEHFYEHADAWNVESATRQVSVIAYLNNVARGGETVFKFGQSQRCEKGTILLFPANFLYHHLARPPKSGPKIVVATWIHFGNDGVPVYLTSPLG